MSGEFTIGDFTVSPPTSSIYRGNASVRIEPKTMDVLVFLAQNAGALVKKEEILCGIWAGNFVAEEVLSNVVWKLRQVFKDDPRKPRYIETIHKKGYRLVAPVNFPERRQAENGPPMVLIGHESERAEVQKCYDSMLLGRLVVVSVSGEAGIGKTTFINDFLRLHAAECYAGRGRCSEHLAGTGAFLPILDVLYDLAGGRSESSLALLLKRTAPCWYAQVFPHAEESAIITDHPAASPEQMKRDLVEFFVAASGLRPILIFFDDVHWADASSVDMGAYICDHCTASRVLILTAHSPDLLDDPDSPLIDVMLRLKSRDICREVPLGLLDSEEVSSYIDQAFPEHRFPPEFACSIHRRTEGNPLFMVDLFAHLRRHEILVRDGENSCWQLGQSLARIDSAIPDSLKNLIELKIRRIDEWNRQVLRCAAIPGSEFDSAVVAHVLETPQAEVEEALQTLEKIHGFVKRLGSLQCAGRRRTERYQFAHVLYQEAVRDQMSPGRRSQLSGAIARALYEIHEETSVPRASQIALLFEEAGDFPEAAKHFTAAAELAKHTAAYPETLNLARKGIKAVEAAADFAERTKILFSLQLLEGMSLTQMKGYADPEVKEAYGRMYAACARSHQYIEASRYLLALATYYIACADYKKALEISRKYRRLPQSRRNQILETWFHLILCAAACHRGSPVRALHDARRCVEIGSLLDRGQVLSFGDLDAGVIGRFKLARILWFCGYPDQARASAELGLTECGSIGHPATSAFAFFMASWFYSYLNDYRRVMEYAKEAIEISCRHGLRVQEGWARSLRGWAMIETGKPREGFRELEGGIHQLDLLGWQLGRTELLGLKAMALTRVGDTEGALSTLDESERLVKSSGERYFEPELYRIRSLILLRAPSPATGLRAESWLRRSLSAAARQGAKSLELRAATALAGRRLQQGRLKDGHDALSPVYHWFTEGFKTPDLREAGRMLRQLSRQGN